ncbi:MAG TPA: nuclear transport factor 2 family protein [Saprospiraceae bacterium]|nr:nuclear transport factor 2 family protein [Saprospiraceae bacterium]HND87122.1 nuclear transport factor 2 family protein [Saprospiraceae bacterium]HNG89856.1 nuclear transport factor 2 family protein [Saprospiraceae bacterium]
MKQLLLFLAFLLLLAWSVSGQPAARTIRNIMAEQEAAWNRGDLPAFMEGYWHSDSLRFIGSKGLTYGWQATLDNYRRGYPDRATMGTLKFTILSVEKLSRRSAFVVGKWHLARGDKGDLSGHYTLLWRKIRGHWVIVADHSS